MSHFAMMMDTLFATFGEDSLLTPNDGSPPRTVRIIVSKLDTPIHIGAAVIISSTSKIEVRISDIPVPQIGDYLAVGATNYVVASDPVRDTERLVWTLSASPPSLWDPASGIPPGPTDGGEF